MLQKKKGFTLVEVLVVILISGLVLSMVASAMIFHINKYFPIFIQSNYTIKVVFCQYFWLDFMPLIHIGNLLKTRQFITNKFITIKDFTINFHR